MSPVEPAAVRVLSFNVNGLRACLKRLHCTIAQLLDLLKADIVCLQETKLRRSELDSELACVDGWDSFFTCDTTSSTGYSGTATYCRTHLALPFASEEGFTGCAALAAAGQGNGAAAVAAAVTPHPALVEHFSVEELTELDAEGRVLVTDHGAFVLFNLYGPAITSSDDERAEERLGFKMRFYQALELRWRHLRQQGRAVVAVGDWNICPAPIDTPEPDPATHYRASRPDRLWLRRLLHGGSIEIPGAAGSGSGGDLPWAAVHATGNGSGSNIGGGPGWAGPAAAAAGAGAGGEHGGGWRSLALADGSGGGAGGQGGSGGGHGRLQLVDTFRHFYPTRQGVATCWSLQTYARVNNWGSRIDLILTAGLSVGQLPPGTASAADLATQVGPATSLAPQPVRVPDADLAAQPDWVPAETGSGSSGGDGQRSGGRGGSGYASGSGMNGSGVGGTVCGVAAPALWVAASEIWPEQEGSDHCPVYADFLCTTAAPFPCAARAPPLAMRNVFLGRQHKLHRWLAPMQPGAAPCSSQAASGEACSKSLQQQQSEQQLREAAAAAAGAGRADIAAAGSQASGGSAAGGGGMSGANMGQGAGVAGAGVAAGKKEGKKQASLRNFFQAPPSQQQQQSQSVPSQQQQQSQSVPAQQQQQSQSVPAQQQQQPHLLPAQQQQQQQPLEQRGAAEPDQDRAPGAGNAEADALAAAAVAAQAEAEAEAARTARQQQSKQVWAGLMAKNKPPLCRHMEPAALLKVNKTGPNKGRYFYSCARPDGPAPEGKCHFFKWVEKKAWDNQPPPAKKSGSGGAGPGSGTGGAPSKRLKT